MPNLIKELERAGVSPADRKRLRSLLEDDEPIAAECVRYIAGISKKAPSKKSGTGLIYYSKQLAAALHDGRGLTDWDERVLEIFASKELALCEDLRDWLPKQIARYPDDDVAGSFVRAAKHLDIYKNEYLFFGIVLHPYTNNRLNSAGRWVLAQVRDNAKQFLKGYPHGPDTSLSRLLAVEAPDLWEKHRKKLPPLSDDEVARARAKAKPAKAKAKAPMKPGDSYAFEQYAARLVAKFLDDLDPALANIRAVRVYVPQSRNLAELVLVETDEEQVYATAPPKSKSLRAAGDDDDKLLESFSDELAWGDYLELPTAILFAELVRAAHQIGKALGKRLAKGATVGLRVDD